MARHAIAPEDKEARRAAILAAARALLKAGDGGLPTAGEIAAAAGLAKGTVYLYFDSKEEIFVALLLDELLCLLSWMEALFAEADGAAHETVAAFIDGYVAHLGAHREVLRLDALCHSALGGPSTPSDCTGSGWRSRPGSPRSAPPWKRRWNSGRGVAPRW